MDREWSGKASLRKSHFSKDLKGGKEGAMEVSRGRAFQAEGTADAKAQRWWQVCPTPG